MSDLSPVSPNLPDKGKTLGEILRGLIKPKKAEKPTKVALPATLSDADRKAMSDLIKAYGGVCPQERVALTPAQLTTVMQERLLLDAVDKVISDRKAGIRTSVLNHMDVSFEVDNKVDDETPVEKDGHYLVIGINQVVAPETHQVFSWEVHPGLPDVNEKRLYELCHTEGSGLTHKDWLAMTYQPQVARAIDSVKAMDYINAHPELQSLLLAAVDDAPPKGSFYVRKQKA